MSDDEPGAIGARLALSNGLSDVIAILEPELTALSNAATASAAMLQELVQLGQGLNAFNANVAPTAVSSQIAHTPDEATQLMRAEATRQSRAPNLPQTTMHQARGRPQASVAVTPRSSIKE